MLGFGKLDIDLRTHSSSATLFSFFPGPITVDLRDSCIQCCKICGALDCCSRAPQGTNFRERSIKLSLAFLATDSGTPYIRITATSESLRVFQVSKSSQGPH